MTIVDEVREVRRLTDQTAYVLRFLQQHGKITRSFAIYEGIPGYGRITRLGARIHELREKGYTVHTVRDHGETIYTLERDIVPEPEAKETQPSFAGFDRYLRKQGINSYDLSPARRSAHYVDYCADIKRQNA